MKTIVQLNLDTSSYPIGIAEGARKQAGQFLATVMPPCPVFIVADPVVADHFGSDLQKSLEESGFSVNLCRFAVSEAEKNLQTVENLYQKMVGAELDRHGCVIALGGGVLGDVVGFAAATFLRGINFVQIPTTLLAQVDSSVGGKVGVNFAGAKNLVGAFYQPKAVIVDPQVLTTLSVRHFLNGMAEVIKYGAIGNLSIIERLEKSQEWLKGYHAGFLPLIIDSIQEKVRVVEQDEREKNLRAILNFGHTMGHALELECANLFHGEAVILGMRFASRLSQKKGFCDEETVERLLALLDNVPVSLSLETMNFSSIWQRMIQDKKRVGKAARFVLLKALGNPCLAEVDKAEIEGLFHETNLWWR